MSDEQFQAFMTQFNERYDALTKELREIKKWVGFACAAAISASIGTFYLQGHLSGH